MSSALAASLLSLVLLLMVSGIVQADMDPEQLTIMLQIADEWPELKVLTNQPWTQANLQSCTATGVTCTSLGYVKSIGLGIREEMNGTLPSVLGDLFCLSNLRVYSRYLHGTIPASLGNLDFLTEFRAPYGHLSGSIPTMRSGLQHFSARFDNTPTIWNPGCLPSSLTTLALYQINFGTSNPIPAEIFSISSLEQLSLDPVTFDGSMPDLLSLVSLTRCSIRGSENMTSSAAPSSGDLPADWSALSSLRHLFLSHLPWGGSLPSTLPSSLISYSIANLPHISGAIPPELFSDHREVVYLAGLPGITGGVIPPDIISPELRSIDLSDLGLNSSVNFSILLAPALEQFTLRDMPSMPSFLLEWPSAMNCSLEFFVVYVFNAIYAQLIAIVDFLAITDHFSNT